MALLHEATDQKKLDVRVLERNVDRGVIAAKDVEKQLKELPDDAANALWTNTDELSNSEG